MEKSEGCWIRDRALDASDSSLDVLATEGTFNGSEMMACQGAESVSYSPLVMPQAPASGAAGSIESAQGGRTDVDSDEELEAIRGSVRSLRAQRLAVEQLKAKAKSDERAAEVLRSTLHEAEERIKDLEARSGKEIVRRLMDEVSELSSRLKATSTVLHTREKSIAELREAIREVERDKRNAQAKARLQSARVDEQESKLQEMQVAFSQLVAKSESLEEKAVLAEKRAQEESSDHRREVESLTTLLSDVKAALRSSKEELESAMSNHAKTLDRARKEKEALLFETGQGQERIKELIVLCEKQRAKLADSGQRAREVEHTAAAARERADVAEKQVSELRSTLSDARERRQEEDAAAATKLRVIAGRADELKTALLEARAEIQEKDRQLTRHKEEMAAFREDVKKLRDLAAQQGQMRQNLYEKEETIRGLRERLELERRERGQWAQVRTELLSQFCHEETKLRSTLQNGGKPQKPQKPREAQEQVRESHWAAPPPPPPWHEGSHEGGQPSRARWSTNSDPSHSIGSRRNGSHHQAKDEGSGRSRTSSRSNSRGGASSDICGARGHWCGERGGEDVAKDPRKVDSASDTGRDRPRRQRRRSKLQHV